MVKEKPSYVFFFLFCSFSGEIETLIIDLKISKTMEKLKKPTTFLVV